MDEYEYVAYVLKGQIQFLKNIVLRDGEKLFIRKRIKTMPSREKYLQWADEYINIPNHKLVEEFANRVWNEAIERAAIECENVSKEYERDGTKRNNFVLTPHDGCDSCAEGIRKIKHDS